MVCDPSVPRASRPTSGASSAAPALIETALDCLHADGLAGVSVRSVCARARLTPRYFYESFADLDELLVAAVDAVTDEVAAQAVAARGRRAPDDLRRRCGRRSTPGYGVVAADPRKATAMLVAAAGHGPLRRAPAQARHRVRRYDHRRLPC